VEDLGSAKGYRVWFLPTVPGIHEASITVNGIHAEHSPELLYVAAPTTS
jgi:hypothetical protein